MGVGSKKDPLYYNRVMRKVTLEILTSPNCTHCEAFLSYWGKEGAKWPSVVMRELSILTPEGQTAALKYQIFASPAIIINNELFDVGGFNKKQLEERLAALSK